LYLGLYSSWDVTQPRLIVVYQHFGTVCLQSATNLRHITSCNSRGRNCCCGGRL